LCYNANIKIHDKRTKTHTGLDCEKQIFLSQPTETWTRAKKKKKKNKLAFWKTLGVATLPEQNFCMTQP
jgi:hypothetical protein